MGKEKKEKRKSGADEDGGEKASWEDRIRYLSPISQPLAPRKLTKRLCKTIKKAKEVKNLTNGIRNVQKCIRKGERGIVVLAGDVSPVDVISHMPLVCEELDIPYCYIPSKEDVGGNGFVSVAVLIKDHPDYKEAYDECFQAVKDLPLPV